MAHHSALLTLGVICPLLCLHCLSYTNQPHSSPDHTQDMNSTVDFITDTNATDSPLIIKQELEPRANSSVPVISTRVQSPVTQTIQTSNSGCTCNLTPDFCDIDCCCDVLDCGIANLSSVFSNCRQDTRAGVCIDSWLMFRANVDPQLVTDTGSLFCVQTNDLDSIIQTSPTSEGLFSIFSPHFSLTEVNSIPSRSVYKFDDVILTYYNATSIVSVLRQPSSGATSSSCLERNPARFLNSGSLSCSKLVSAQSCRRDSSVSFSSYFTGLSLLKVPRPSETDITKIMIPVIPLVNLPEPVEHNGTCMNVVTKVEYVITYTSVGEITAATVNVNVTDASYGTQLLQQHAVQFQLATPTSAPPKLPLVGLEVGTPVIGWFAGQAGPLTMPGPSLGGACSTETTSRAPILFMHNTITGCTFRSMLEDCTSLRAQMYSILRGTMTPNTVAMTAGSQPQQSRVVVQECPEPALGEVCKTGCLVPVSLSVRILWAQRGMLALPQNHILGVKYVFSCQTVECPTVSPLPLTMEVMFSDTTVYPEPPRAKPQPQWKFPFGFFTRGMEEVESV